MPTKFTIIFYFSIEVGNPGLISNGGGGLSLATSDVWSDEKWLGPRAQFQPDAFPAILRVHNVRGSDAGQYRCRVDFTEAPTRNTIVSLSVIGKVPVTEEKISILESVKKIIINNRSIQIYIFLSFSSPRPCCDI